MDTRKHGIQKPLEHVCEKNVEIIRRLEKCLECCKQRLIGDVNTYTLNPKDQNADRNVDRKDYAQVASDGNKQSTGDQTSSFNTLWQIT